MKLLSGFNGSDFVTLAHQMIEKNIRMNQEFYVAPVYNEMIEAGKYSERFHVIPDCISFLGET